MSVFFFIASRFIIKHKWTRSIILAYERVESVKFQIKRGERHENIINRLVHVIKNYIVTRYI